MTTDLCDSLVVHVAGQLAYWNSHLLVPTDLYGPCALYKTTQLALSPSVPVLVTVASKKDLVKCARCLLAVRSWNNINACKVVLMSCYQMLRA